MSEVVPSAIFHAQALKLLEELAEKQRERALTPSETAEELQDILAVLEDKAGRPIFDYWAPSFSEAPSSEKINQMWKALSADLNILQHQVDLNRASSVEVYNSTTTEIQQAKLQNGRMNNKLKTLQMYSSASDSSISVFGETFQSLGSLDIDLITPSEQPYLAAPGYVTLPRQGEMINLSAEASVEVLDSSNGFVGNNQEVLPVTDTLEEVQFKADQEPAHTLESVLDGSPNTRLEYEKYFISPTNRARAGNLNFEYRDQEGNRKDWADGIADGDSLKLSLEIDLGAIENVNSISFTPFGLEDGDNFPVLVRLIQTSTDRTNWDLIRPSEVYVGTDVNLSIARLIDSFITKEAFWRFSQRSVRYVRLYLEQSFSLDAMIGHPYWVPRGDKEPEDRARVEGPLPNENKVALQRQKIVDGNLEQYFEAFPGKRWVIGVKDFDISQINYATTGTFVTKPLRVDGVVDRVILEDADFDIPEEFDFSKQWVRFYISPDNGENWFPISEIEDTYNEIPEQISFNDPLPDNLREPGVKNYNTNMPVTEVRLKIEMERPASLPSFTPVISSYKVKVKRR